MLEKIFGSDEEAPIDVKPKAERVLPPTAQPIPENMERVYDSEEEYYFITPKPNGASPLDGLRPAAPRAPQTESEPKNNIKGIIKTKPTTKANPPSKPRDNIYSTIKFRCEECNE